MSTIRVNSIQHTTSNSGNMVLHANGNVSMGMANSTLFVGNTAISNAGISVGGTTVSAFGGMKNRLINGDMKIDQRWTGSSNTWPGSATFTVDRWQIENTQSGKITFQQNHGSVTPPAGFTNYIGLKVAATATIGASDYFLFFQNIEGNNLYDFDLGKSTASVFTLSFWAYSNVTGTLGAVIKSSGQNYSYPFTYTINSANTWEYKTVTVARPTSGTWGTGTSGTLLIGFNLGCGSTYSGSPDGTWQSVNVVSATGGASLMGSTSNYLYLTGIQVEKGPVATPFEFRHYGTELNLCKRYYWQIVSGTGQEIMINGTAFQTNQWETVVTYPVEMRSVPTITFTAPSTWATRIGGTSPSSALSYYYADATIARMQVLIYAPYSGLTQGQSNALSSKNPSIAAMYFSAEI